MAAGLIKRRLLLLIERIDELVQVIDLDKPVKLQKPPQPVAKQEQELLPL